jgi:hypothetical protein
MLESHPPLSPGRIVGLALTAVLFLLNIGFLILLFLAPIGIVTVLLGLLIILSLPLIGVVIYVTVGISSALYRVENGLLLIKWGRLVQAVPMRDIVEILSSDAIVEVSDFRGIRWPGCMIGQGQIQVGDGRELHTSFYSTRMVEEQVFIVTEKMTYGLSPGDSFAFTASLRALLESDLGEEEATAYTEMDILGWSIWPDRKALILVGTSVILNLLLFAVLSVIYSRLPEQVPLHFSRFGVIDRSGSPSELFILPLIGLVAWIAALVAGWFFYYLRHEKPVAYIIWGITVVIEVAAWIAVLGLIR